MTYTDRQKACIQALHDAIFDKCLMDLSDDECAGILAYLESTSPVAGFSESAPVAYMVRHVDFRDNDKLWRSIEPQFVEKYGADSNYDVRPLYDRPQEPIHDSVACSLVNGRGMKCTCDAADDRIGRAAAPSQPAAAPGEPVALSDEMIAQAARASMPEPVSVDAAVMAADNGLTYPAAFNDELAWILGLICFECIEYARALRKGGRDIPPKAEAEQAHTLDWMLRHYMRDPENWRKNAADEARSFVTQPAGSTGEPQ